MNDTDSIKRVQISSRMSLAQCLSRPAMKPVDFATTHNSGSCGNLHRPTLNMDVRFNTEKASYIAIVPDGERSLPRPCGDVGNHVFLTC